MKRGWNILVAVLMVISMLAGGALGETSPDPEIEDILSGMTLEEKVGQMMLVSFRVWKNVPDAART